MMLSEKLEEYRIQEKPFDSDLHSPNGAFRIPFENNTLLVISSDGFGWDHVSVSLKKRCPNWREMSFVKDLFFGPEECALQFHPPKSAYVNNHAYCLHLWRKQGPEEHELPPQRAVGVQKLGEIYK